MSGEVLRPGESPTSLKLRQLQQELAFHLEAIQALFEGFKDPKVTLLVRNSDLPDGDVIIGDDDFDVAADTIKRHGLAIAAAQVPKRPPAPCPDPNNPADILVPLESAALSPQSWEGALEILRPIVPATYGEAVQLYRWLLAEVPPHEWDNRTTVENAAWLIRTLTHTSLTPQLIVEEPRAFAFAGVVLAYVNKAGQLGASLRYLPDMMDGRVNPLPTLDEVLEGMAAALIDARERQKAERGGN